jgi:hypothetical protein
MRSRPSRRRARGVLEIVLHVHPLDAPPPFEDPAVHGHEAWTHELVTADARRRDASAEPSCASAFPASNSSSSSRTPTPDLAG